MKQVDVLVVGGGLGGCMAALRAAKNGKRVVLCEIGEALGKEISSYMQPFLPKSLLNKNRPLYEIGAINDQDILFADSGHEVPIFSGMVRSSILGKLLEAGVKVLYMAYPVAVAVKDGRACGLVLATKFGAYLLCAGAIIDTTDGVVAALCRGNSLELKDDVTVSYSFECEHVYPEKHGLALPLELGDFLDIDIKNVVIHKGKRTDDTVFVTFSFADSLPGPSARRAGRLYATAHKKTLLLCSRLKQQFDWFSSFGLNSIGYNVSIEGAVKNSCGIKGIFALNKTLPWGFSAEQFIEYSQDVVKSADMAVQCCDFLEPDTLLTVGGALPLSLCDTGRSLDDPFLNLDLRKIDLKALTHTIKTEIAIAGGGTGGSAAAMGTLKSGRDVLIAEAKGMLGGTRTLGLVSAFWHGYIGGFAGKNRLEIKEFAQNLVGDNFVHPCYAEALYYSSMLLDDNKQLLFNSIIFDVIKTQNKVTGLLVATEYGPVKVECDILIDATGDGDAAYFAGAEYSYADPRDGVTQGYSMWGVDKPNINWRDSHYKGDPDSLSGEYYSDMLRGIYIAQLDNSPIAFSPIMTVREGRHIKGLYTLNLKDIVLGTTFEDTIAVSKCLYDAHGVGSSPVYNTFLFDPVMPFPNQEDVKIRIPYRCVIPKGIEGMMVIAKAISATRDAACLVRMNADIQNLGYAAGMMAAESARLGILPSKADPRPIQPKLIELEILPEWWNKTPNLERQRIVLGVMEGDKPSMLLAAADPDFKDLLKNAFEVETDAIKKRNLGLVLACHKDFSGFDLLLCHFKELTATLPQNPRGGMRTLMTYLTIFSWSFSQNEDLKGRLVPAIAEFLNVAEAGGEFVDPSKGIYQNSKVSNRTVPNFRALLSAASAAEILADAALKEPLEQLMMKKNINCGQNRDIHVVQLYLRLAAAAARCGSKKGVNVLIENLSDTRAFFKNFIRSELREISGFDHGYSQNAWLECFNGMDQIPITPKNPPKEFIY